MYYTENNHNKVVLRDFYLSRFENGPITEPCGTPEYLGRTHSFYQYLLSCPLNIALLPRVSPSLICFHVLSLVSSHVVKIDLWAYFHFLSCLRLSPFEDHNLSEVNCYCKKLSGIELKALRSAPLPTLPLYLCPLISCVLSRSSHSQRFM